MNKREVVFCALRHRRPPYVPWDLALSGAVQKDVAGHFGKADASEAIGNHFQYLSSAITHFKPDAQGILRDGFGVRWKAAETGESFMSEGIVLEEPTLEGVRFPDPFRPEWYAHLPGELAKYPDRFRIFAIGYTLLERAWTLRGMENLMTDFGENPEFVHALFDRITEVNLGQLEQALKLGFDCVHLGDDWGHQQGLLISPGMWREYIRPRYQRLFDFAKSKGLHLSIHSCGAVHPLFEDLIDMGLDLMNPFQPEAMDVHALLPRYRGRLAFHGGLSTQQLLPRGTPDEVRAETRQLLEQGGGGGYIFAPGHGIDIDVPLNNTLAMIEVLHAQPGWRNR